MLRILRSAWMVSLTGCLLYLATTAALLGPQQFAGAHVISAAKPSPNDDPSWRFRNPEFEQWVEELKQERETLSLRDKELRELQARLEAERLEILSVTQAVHQLQADFDKQVIRFTEQERENLKKQTKVVAGMSPEGAAAMLYQMPEDEMVRILFMLKPDEASNILDALSKKGKEEAKRAAVLTERLRSVMPSSGKGSRSPAS